MLGKIIEYIDQGRVVCTLCLQDKGNRLHLLTPLNREVSLAPNRALLVSETTLDVRLPREQILDRLRRTEEARIRLKELVQVEELWELVREESEIFSHRYLAHLVFGDTLTDDHCSALVRALFENRLYFKMKDSQFLPNPLEKVEQIQTQQAQEEARAEKLRQWGGYLKDLREGRPAEPPFFQEEIVHHLEQLALHGTESPDFEFGKKILQTAGVQDVASARDLLIAMGVWEEDENLDLLRMGINPDFSPEELDEALFLGGRNMGLNGREDLRDLPLMTIDSPLTQDYDDAISLEVIPEGFRLGIHIADVSVRILPESLLDRTGARRASSQYLPRRSIPMLPTSLSHDVLSLREGQDRPAISLLARFDPVGNLLDYRFTASVIQVKDRLSYGLVNEQVESHPTFQSLAQLSQALRHRRMLQGALNLSLPELEVDFQDDGRLSLELVEQDTPSRTLVAECMIFYNQLIAQFCKEHQIPILFRSQPEASERLPFDERGYIYYVFQQRRKLSPLQIATTPRAHTGLGVPVYTQATSPIRRYLDLVVQRQVASFLQERPLPYNEAQMEAIRETVDPVIRNLGAIKRNRLRYWTLKYLAQHRGEAFQALILDELKTTYRLVLKDFLLIAYMRRENGFILRQAQQVLVKVKKAIAWEDVLVLQYQKE